MRQAPLLSGRAEPVAVTLTEFLPGAALDHDKRQGRFGVVYLRALAAQAGCTFREPDPDEDVDAVDGWIGLGSGYVPVQVKSNRVKKIGVQGSIGYAAEPHWIRRWNDLRSQAPIFFVVVVVPANNRDWLEHDAAGTSMKDVAAYWTRVDPVRLQTTPYISTPRKNRLTAETFVEWRDELDGMFR